jgi:hypothetical protein
MKKLIFIAVLFLMTGIVFSQSLQKGNVLGFHNGTFILNPDVTLNQCVNFMKEKYIPEFEKNFSGVKCYILKGIRGEGEACISITYVFPSDDIRLKYWKSEGVYTDTGNAASEKMKALDEEMGKYVIKIIDKYTDWVVQ